MTGDLERRSMADSLAVQFPASDAHGHPVVWLQTQKVAPATTHRLKPAGEPSGPMKALAKKVLAEAWEGEDGTPADLIVALDDLELHNFDQVSVVYSHFRLAIEDVIRQRNHSQRTEQRLRDRVRERCSFHLLCPMVEAYFFGEVAALTRAGCALGIEPQLANDDVENFECCDPAWLPICEMENQRKAGSPNPMPWWREERHPKRYLEYLVGRNGGFYDEVAGGKEALRCLDWPRVPAGSASVALVRALFEDIAGFLGVRNPLGSGLLSASAYPVRSKGQNERSLRNL